MINRYISIFLILFTTCISVTHAADDPMKSLFLFQKQMAENGNSSAMMKLGEMYERGDGVAQSNANALKMYEKAKAAKHKGADAAIQRIKNAGNKSAAMKKRQDLERKKAEENKRREENARRKAEEEQRLKAEKENAAREKADKAEKQRQAKLKAEKLRTEQKKNAAIKAAAVKAKEQQKAAAQKAAAIKAAAEEAKAKQALIQAEKKRRQQEQTTKQEVEGFKSDPCKSPAARLLSTCRNK